MHRHAIVPYSISVLFVAVGAASAQVALNSAPTRVVGHPQLRLVADTPNLADARSLNFPAGVAVDQSATPPILYVADTGNNRVLAWRNASAFTNGAPADLVIGQRDFVSTVPQGPGTPLSTGLFFPTSVAVDAQGNLYVADSGNNRILRYSRPFAQPDETKFPETVIGQANFNGGSANAGGLSAQTLALNVPGRGFFRTGMLFDTNGNLWFSDAGNNRVLRYLAASLRPGGHQPAADLVIGQFNFTTNLATNDRRNKAALAVPSGLAMDPTGRLYVCDSLNRVLVYTNLGTGAIAARIMGVVVTAPGAQAPPEVNEGSLGRLASPPEGVFFASGTPFVLDTGANRIVRYDPFESWPTEGSSFSPPGRVFIGQPDSASFRANRGQPEPSSSGFNTPVAAAVAGNEVFIVDGANHRILVFPLQTAGITTASRLLGQAEFHQSAVNNIEGREMFLYSGLSNNTRGSDGAGIAVDARSNPPRLYVADTYNHRILGFSDLRKVRPGDKADLVIGQRDFQRALINDPTNDANQVTNNGLFLPAGLAVDDAGNLYVADSGNGRVLRYQRPFEQSSSPRPDLVLGQPSFFVKITDATARNMSRPYGLAFTVDGHLLVSDMAHNRILFFRKPAGADFTNGQAAEKVLGQPDFSSVVGSNAPNRLITPRSIATDTDDRLYVCDTGNNRVFVYDRVTVADNDPAPAFTFPFNFGLPHGIHVSHLSGEIWLTDTTNYRSFRFQRFERLVFNPQPDFELQHGRGNLPLALTQDGFGNLLIAESVNRVSLFFPRMFASNGGNQLFRFAPSSYTTLKPTTNAAFGDLSLSYTEVADTPPLPNTLADIQVLINDIPAPLQSVAPGQINFIMPSSAPTRDTVEAIVVRPSTGQVLSATSIPMSPVAPAFFTANGEGFGQIVARNADGTANSAVDRAGRSEVIHLFGTGQGAVGNAPPVGATIPDKNPIEGDLRVLIGTDFVPAENIEYSGLAPGMVGVWQISVKIPDRVAPDPAVPVVAVLNSVPTNSDATGRRVTTTIAVKP